MDILGEISEVMHWYRPLKKVEMIDPKGRHWVVDETWVRAFQLVANKASDEKFAWIKEHFTIYSGPERHEKMILRRDGKFENEFEGGFFDGTANMAFEIF